jgi:ribosomal-protein-alanine N-acetyltransferase
MNPKIKLRKIAKSDWPYFLKWWKDKELINLTSGIYEDNDKILEDYFSDMLKSEKNNYYLIIFEEKAIGNISLIHKESITFEIQIVIGEKEYWGRGAGTAAVKKVLDIAFNKLGYNSGYLEVQPNNQRAINLYKDCGFKETGIKKYPENKFQPVVVTMVIKKDDFIKTNIQQ